MHFIQMTTVVYSVYIILFNVLICFVRLNDSCAIEDLNITCGIGYSKNYDLNDIRTLPEGCTSILLDSIDYSNDNSDMFDKYVEAIQTTGLPLFTIFSNKDYNEWLDLFKSDQYNAEEVANEYLYFVKKYSLTGIIINNLYSLDEKIHVSFYEHVQKLFETIREISNADEELQALHIENHGDGEFTNVILLGMVIPYKVLDIPHSNFDSLVDVYLVNSTNYRPCDTSLISTDLPVDIYQTVNNLTEQSNILNTKLIMTMDLSVVYLDPTTGPTHITYTDSCKSCANTPVCISTKQQMYTKARVLSGRVTGIYIKNVNMDDAKDTCRCGVYAGTNTIISGYNGDKYEQNCNTLGVSGINTDSSLVCTLLESEKVEIPDSSPNPGTNSDPTLP